MQLTLSMQRVTGADSGFIRVIRKSPCSHITHHNPVQGVVDIDDITLSVSEWPQEEVNATTEWVRTNFACKFFFYVAP